MKMIRLGDVATYINGYAFKPEDRGVSGLPIIRIQDLTGNSYDIGYYDGAYPAKIEINNGDILISWSASLGIYVWNRGKALLNQHIFKVVFDKIEINRSYFVYAIRYKLEEMGLKSHGATMKHIIKKDFDETKIPYLSLEMQQDIVARLDLVSNIVNLRKKELNNLDLIIKARFVEMFGDPVSNQMEWETISWKDTFDTKTGKVDSNAAVEGGEFPFFTCAKEWLRINHYAYDCEALLLAGNNAAGIYDVKYYKGKFNAYQRTYILQLKNRECEYPLFQYQLQDRLTYLQSQSKGSNTRYLTMEILNSLSFINPPIELQKNFSVFVNQVDKSKVVVQKALNEAQTLLDSLMQEYFG